MALASYIWASPDFAGNAISVTFSYDDITLILSLVTAVRDVGCVYHHIYFGVGVDGIPNSTAVSLKNIPSDTPATFPLAIINGMGLTTITDVHGVAQTTAGP